MGNGRIRVRIGSLVPDVATGSDMGFAGGGRNGAEGRGSRARGCGRR